MRHYFLIGSYVFGCLSFNATVIFLIVMQPWNDMCLSPNTMFGQWIVMMAKLFYPIAPIIGSLSAFFAEKGKARTISFICNFLLLWFFLFVKAGMGINVCSGGIL